MRKANSEDFECQCLCICVALSVRAHTSTYIYIYNEGKRKRGKCCERISGIKKWESVGFPNARDAQTELERDLQEHVCLI